MAQGKRAGSRPKRQFRPALLGLALGVTACVVAWGYLVHAAIDFGATARGGDGTAWWFLVLAAVGAMLCLFLALVLAVRIARALGITRPPPATDAPTTVADRSSRPGGRRAAR